MIPAHVYERSVLSFLEPVGEFLRDGTVTEILINGHAEIFVERRGQLTRTEAAFPSEESLRAALRNIAQYAGRHFDEQHPILEGRLPDGSRIEAILPPAAPEGPSVAIRRFSRNTLTIERLVELGALPADAAALLRALVVSKQNIIVAGGTGSGKTSLLNALGSFIPDAERTIVIEDARELELMHDHVVFLEARPPDPRGKGAVAVRDLFRASLRMRPDRIVVGEIRGGEALDLIQAMTSGHGGCLSTVHATYPRDTLNRLETMALMSDVALPLSALRAQLASAVDVLVQTSRMRDGSRKITHISEVRGIGADGSYLIADLYAGRYVERASGSGCPSSASTFRLVPTGELPQCSEAIAAQGERVPEQMLRAARARGAGRGSS
jgi:pilus assembly protein CpaF